MIMSFVEFLIQNNYLEEKYREDSIYGLTVLLEKMVVCTILFGMSLLLGKSMEGMVFIVCFLLLRQATGGFHANTFLGCLIGSIVTVLLVLEVFVALTEQHMILFGILLIFSVVCILLFAPINHPNLRLTFEEQRKHRYWSRVILFVEVGISGAGFILKMKWHQYIMMAIIICAVFIVIAKLLRQEVKMDEGKEDRVSYS